MHLEDEKSRICKHEARPARMLLFKNFGFEVGGGLARRVPFYRAICWQQQKKRITVRENILKSFHNGLPLDVRWVKNKKFRFY